MQGEVTPSLPFHRSKPATRIEERKAPRYTLMMRQAKLRTAKSEFLCVVRDLSVSGISIRTFHPLPPGDCFTVELRDGHPYSIEKVWERDGEAGFKFRDPVALEEILAEDACFPRRPMRVAVTLPATVMVGPDRGTALITNLSQQGARIEADRAWAHGQLMRVAAPGLAPRYAKVRWRHDQSHGLVFEETFSLREFADFLAQIDGNA
ncbi:PilZ domain-containing protein [Qipengyuania sp. CAU 1752]